MENKVDYNKLFLELLEVLDLELIENSDDRYIDTNKIEHNGKYSIIDLQGGNWNNIESERFSSAQDLLERLDCFIDDFIIKPIGDSLKDIGIKSFHYDYSLLQYREKLPDQEWDFKVLDMVANHTKEIDLKKCCVY